MKLLSWLAVAALAALGLALGYEEHERTTGWEKLRVMVTVSDGHHDVSGSAVWRTRVVNGIDLNSMPVEGDAFPIDLGGNRVLYGILATTISQRLSGVWAIPDQMDITTVQDVAHRDAAIMAADHSRTTLRRAVIKRLGDRAVPLCYQPTSRFRERTCVALVAVPDPAHPLDAVLLNPEDLASYFGKGVALKSMSVRFVSNQTPVTRDILDRLPALKSVGPKDKGMLRASTGMQAFTHNFSLAYYRS